MADLALLFGQNELPGLQIADALLIALRQRAVCGVQRAVYESLDIALDIDQLLLHGINESDTARRLGIPEVFQHRVEQVEELFARTHSG